MSTILIAWELGAGFGHMAPLRPLIQRLTQKHRVLFAVRDLSRSQVIFKGDTLSLLQAPVKIGPIANQILFPSTYPQILHNVGYETADELAGYLSGWRTLYENIRPDLAIFDHSPTAMLATRGLPMRRLVMGSGFLCPRPDRPMANLRPWMAQAPGRLEKDEDRILATINAVLERCNAPGLEYAGQIFKDVDDTILTTFPEFDHYGTRKAGRYWGLRPNVSAGIQPEWPAIAAARVYAYLKPFQFQNELYKAISALDAVTLVASDRVPEEVQRQHSSERLTFSSQHYDLAAVSQQCAMAILNANHDTMIQLLLRGIPLAMVPLTLEQWILARCAERIGVGLLIDPERPAEFALKLREVLLNPAYRANAQRFAEHYCRFDVRSQQLRMEDYVESMLSASFRAEAAEGVLIPPESRLPELPPVQPLAAHSAVSSAHVASGPIDNPEADAEELQRAIELHQRGSIDAAAAIYQALLARQPLNVDALHLLGVVCIQRNDPRRAIELIGRALALKPQEASFHSNLAEAYRALQSFDKAVEHGLLALRFQPVYPEASNNLGLALAAQKKYKAAAARFNEAIRHHPRYGTAYCNLARVAAIQGDLAQAHSMVQKAMELEPANAALKDFLLKIETGEIAKM